MPMASRWDNQQSQLNPDDLQYLVVRIGAGAEVLANCFALLHVRTSHYEYLMVSWRSGRRTHPTGVNDLVFEQQTEQRREIQPAWRAGAGTSRGA